MKKKILVADDDAAILEATTLILEEFGFTVDAAQNGATINKVKESPPDLILLDIWMSGHDGREICKYLKAHKQTNRIPIIMISASRDIKESALQAGADDFLEKPFNISDLLGKIDKQLQKSI